MGITAQDSGTIAPDFGGTRFQRVRDLPPSVDIDAFFSLGKEIDSHKRNLPHLGQDKVLVFVTFRLADSLPGNVAQRLSEECYEWLAVHPKPWSDEEVAEYEERFPAKIAQLLDAGHGECLLARRDCAEIVSNALRHFDGVRYSLHSYVVMPNHVHVLFELGNRADLSKIVFSWKSFTANGINALLGRRGTLWQSEYFDRLIRSERHYRNTVDYICKNAVAAKYIIGGMALDGRMNALEARSPNVSKNASAARRIIGEMEQDDGVNALEARSPNVSPRAI